MTLGSGIAVAAIWICVGVSFFVIPDKSVGVAVIALIATLFCSGAGFSIEMKE